MILRFLALPILSLILLAPQRATSGDQFRIAFGSCNNQDLPQPLWSAVVENEPDVWVWLGDIVYGDTTDMTEMRAKYAVQNRNEGYRRLVAMTEVIGTWDDHDYGWNDAGEEYPMRVESQKELLDFLVEPEDSPRRKQEGVYASYDFGEGDRGVRIILLDARYHREEPGPGSDILGEAQWKWLETQLRESPAAVNVIGTGYQVLAAEQRYEKWANFPAARERLLDLVRESGARGVLFITGDRHQAEISMVLPPEVAYPVYDVTSSGLTHITRGNTGEENRHRVAGPVAELNFGLITIDWASKSPVLKMEVRGEENAVLMEETVPLETLEK